MTFTSCYGGRDITDDGKLEMTSEEFRQWLKSFDFDDDNQISQEELQQAIRYTGGWFSRMKSKHGIMSADKDRNGFLDDAEIKKLKDFANKNLGVKIVA